MTPDTKRLIQHIPPGMLAAFLVELSTSAGILYFLGFWLYEFLQEWKKNDRSYKDAIGFLDGFTAMATLILLYRRFV